MYLGCFVYFPPRFPHSQSQGEKLPPHILWEPRCFCCLQGNPAKSSLHTPGISDFTKTEGHLQAFPMYYKEAERIKNMDLFHPFVPFKSLLAFENIYVQDKPKSTWAALPATHERTSWKYGPIGWATGWNDLTVTAQGMSWALDKHGRKGHKTKKKKKKNQLVPLSLPIPRPCRQTELSPPHARQHHLVKHPDPSQDSLQIWLHNDIFYGIFHKPDYYFSGNSLMSYRAMGRFSSLMVTALHLWHRHIDCNSIAPKFSSFNRGFVVFPSIPRMSLLKYIYLVWYHGWSISPAVKHPLYHQVPSWNQSKNTMLVQ